MELKPETHNGRVLQPVIARNIHSVCSLCIVQKSCTFTNYRSGVTYPCTPRERTEVGLRNDNVYFVDVVPTKPKKPHIKDLKCFKTVASILGNSRAQLELFKVVHTDGVMFEDKKDLRTTFLWGNTPQGQDFWRTVQDRIVEKEL